MSRNFYRDLTTLKSFSEATDTLRHTQLPPDWWVVVADVLGSTAAIEGNRYKDVNTVGAATVMAIINVDRATDVPFVFGGDGALLAIPPHLLHGTRQALLGSQELAKNGFNLELRVGMIQAKDLFAKDFWLGVGKYQLSKNLSQTTFSGFGWSWAEAVIKDKGEGRKYLVTEDESTKANADFTGFECRWQPVKARNDFKLAIIVQSMLSKAKAHSSLYDEVLAEFSKIFGDISSIHPLASQSRLRLSFDPGKLIGEVKVKRTGQSPFSLIFGVLKLMATSAVGMLAFTMNLKIMGVGWGKYRGEVIGNTDFRKFDGALKMLIDAKVGQEEHFREFLERKRKEGTLVYGLHRSTHAIMTCFVFTPGQDHAHFVDGSDGGYAMAAKMMKEQLSDRKSAGPPVA